MNPEEIERRILQIIDSPRSAWPELLGSLLADAPGQQDVIRSIASSNSVLSDLLDRMGDTDLMGFDERPRSAVAEPGPPSRIGPYRIRQRLASGGMGSVYLAERSDGLRQRVAIKLIKKGMDSEEILRRFEAERQVLALMSHAAIARVLDGGHTDSGQPYFVMEYVDGVPITSFCDENRLSVTKRLELFLQVCYGVQHAHQKGIVHRDLKPSNILVTVIDGEPQVKIIDFGLAKALFGSIGNGPMLTVLGQVMGTPEYMSPEQASGSTLDVDAATDVYSLGVILYELLVGARPHSRADLQRAGIEGVAQHLRETEAPRPSTRLDGGDEARAVARRRGTELRALLRELRQDLDWVVMRAIEKDRTRRYLSPSELAADILRFLQGDVVSAGPPSAMLRVRKLIRRQRLLFTTGAAAVVGLTFSLLIALSLWREARKLDGIIVTQQALRDRASDELDAAQKLADEAAARDQEAQEREAAAELREREANQRVALASAAITAADEKEREAAEAKEREQAAIESRDLALERVKEVVAAEQRAREEQTRAQEEARDLEIQLDRERKAIESVQRDLQALRSLGTSENLRIWLEARAELLTQRARSVERLSDEQTAQRLIALSSEVAWLSDREGGEFHILRGVDPSVAAALDDSLERLADLRSALDSRAADAANLLREHRAAATSWRQAQRRVATSEAYGGLEVAPRFGLVPLDRRANGYELFWHVASGARPQESQGRLQIDEDTGMILVLLPGGPFLLGAQTPQNGRRENLDPQAQSGEGPPKRVKLAPFFVSLCELTVGQWRRLAGLAGGLPVPAPPEHWLGAEPMGGVTHELATDVLVAVDCHLPTEAQWEYACRAGSSTPFAYGPQRNLAGAANLAGVAAPTGLQPGRRGLLAVGQLKPNAFGLLDVHGNAAEWCLDRYGDYDRDPITRDGSGERMVANTRSPARVVRGGHAGQAPSEARSAARHRYAATHSEPWLGLRPIVRIR